MMSHIMYVVLKAIKFGFEHLTSLISNRYCDQLVSSNETRQRTTEQIFFTAACVINLHLSCIM